MVSSSIVDYAKNQKNLMGLSWMGSGEKTKWGELGSAAETEAEEGIR